MCLESPRGAGPPRRRQNMFEKQGKLHVLGCGYDIVRVKVMACCKNCKGNPKFRKTLFDSQLSVLQIIKNDGKITKHEFDQLHGI